MAEYLELDGYMGKVLGAIVATGHKINRNRREGIVDNSLDGELDKMSRQMAQHTAGLQDMLENLRDHRVDDHADDPAAAAFNAKIDSIADELSLGICASRMVADLALKMKRSGHALSSPLMFLADPGASAQALAAGEGGPASAVAAAEPATQEASGDVPEQAPLAESVDEPSVAVPMSVHVEDGTLLAPEDASPGQADRLELAASVDALSAVDIRQDLPAAEDLTFQAMQARIGPRLDQANQWMAQAKSDMENHRVALGNFRAHGSLDHAQENLHKAAQAYRVLQAEVAGQSRAFPLLADQVDKAVLDCERQSNRIQAFRDSPKSGVVTPRLIRQLVESGDMKALGVKFLPATARRGPMVIVKFRADPIKVPGDKDITPPPVEVHAHLDPVAVGDLHRLSRLGLRDLLPHHNASHLKSSPGSDVRQPVSGAFVLWAVQQALAAGV